MFTKPTRRFLPLGIPLFALSLAACGDNEASSSSFLTGETDATAEATPSPDAIAPDAPQDSATNDSAADSGNSDAPDTAIHTDASDGGSLAPDASDGGNDTALDGALEDGDSDTDASTNGWIGSACGTAYDCAYSGALCLTGTFPAGMCSKGCTGLCPDSADPDAARTFCIDNPTDSKQAICVAKCDWVGYPSTGCRSGYVCRVRQRSTDETAKEDVCIPDDGTFSTKCVGDEVRQPNIGIVEAQGLGGCLSGMAPVQGSSTLCIDVYEAHLEEILTTGKQVPFSPYFNPGTHRVVAMSAKAAVPQGYINEIQSSAACSEAGKRLCTQEEWELACRGPSNQVYPYGNTRITGRCNDHRDVHPAIEYFGTSADWIWSELGNSCISQLPKSLATCGAYSGCVTASGIFDLMGNVHEWIDDPAGTFKGGYYVDTVLNGEGCLYTTTAHDISHWDYSTGFRCCASK